MFRRICILPTLAAILVAASVAAIADAEGPLSARRTARPRSCRRPQTRRSASPAARAEVSGSASAV